MTELNCPFCKSVVSWRTYKRDYNDGGMNPVRQRILGCQNSLCLVQPTASYDDHIYVWGRDQNPPVANHYLKVDRNAEFEAVWRRALNPSAPY